MKKRLELPWFVEAASQGMAVNSGCSIQELLVPSVAAREGDDFLLQADNGSPAHIASDRNGSFPNLCIFFNHQKR